jgi:hypothetical protein
MEKQELSKQSALQSLLDEVSAATKSAEKSRDGARTSVVEAVRALETALQERLDGGTLRGLKNLGHNRDPLYAARIRGKPDGRVKWPDTPMTSTDTLVLSPKGKLQVAVCRTDERGDMYDIELRDAADEDITTEDLENLLRTLIDIVPRTVAYADKARDRYAALRELSLNAMRLLTGDKV